MNELLAYLNTIRPLTPALAEQIKKVFNVRKAAKGSFLVKAGDENDIVIFVLSGLLRCFTVDRKGTEVSKCFLQTSDLMISGTAHQPGTISSLFIQTLAPSSVMLCAKIEWQHLYNHFPEFEHHGRILTERHNSKLNLLLDGIRMRTASERYLFLKREFPDLILSVTNKHLASYLGMNHVTLSRTRSLR